MPFSISVLKLEVCRLFILGHPPEDWECHLSIGFPLHSQSLNNWESGSALFPPSPLTLVSGSSFHSLPLPPTMKAPTLATSSKDKGKRIRSRRSPSNHYSLRPTKKQRRHTEVSEHDDDKGDGSEDEQDVSEYPGLQSEEGGSEDSSDEDNHPEGVTSPNTQLLATLNAKSDGSVKSREARDINYFFERGDKKTGKKTICRFCRCILRNSCYLSLLLIFVLVMNTRKTQTQ